MMQTAMAADPARESPSWGFEEGDEIAPGRSILRVLGGGRRFEVVLAWDDHLFAIMVAKVIRPDQVESPKALRELREESEALARLSHPVLVRGFDAVLDGPHPHVLIEHLEGPTLLLPLAAHVAAALHYMHEEGWVHLDTKPDNIVMGVPPRLIDLSIACTVEDAARLTGSIGTDAGRTQGTGRETRGNTDPRNDTGVSTRGETDGRDGTGKTERR